MLTLESTIESILFFKAEPVSLADISSLLGKDVSEIEEGLTTLEKKLEGRGIVLVRNGNEVLLETVSEASPVIEKLVKEELSKDIGKAGLEVLSLVLYRGPVSKSEIDYIRGVNSSFILRNLMIRGLVERSEERGKNRSFVYKPTFDLISHLGIKDVSDLPEFSEVKREMESIKEENESLDAENKNGNE